ncbi:hypothetical protein KCU62_g2350, partial [Aureobasidium sp. EXF-3399]
MTVSANISHKVFSGEDEVAAFLLSSKSTDPELDDECHSDVDEEGDEEGDEESDTADDTIDATGDTADTADTVDASENPHATLCS